MIPENQKEALRQSKCPCDFCDVGWATIGASEDDDSCHNHCEYYKEYCDTILNKQVKEMVKRIIGEITNGN